MLEQVLQENCAIRAIPKSGAYSGIPVVVSQVQDEKVMRSLPIGVVDVVGTVGTIDPGLVFGAYPDIIRQVVACLKERITAP